ncbi:MAG TPA: heme o synthase [Bacteroidota bacterium]|nr:heme o synthase [Bacteroidota bacterium]
MNGDAEAVRSALPYSRPLLRTITDYVELMKPELTSLSVLTALCSFYMAHTGTWVGSDFWLLANLALGTTLLGGGAGALNQYIERDYDRLMKRTEKRPLPAGRLSPYSALLFGIIVSILGVLELEFFVNGLTGFLGVAILSSYLFLYTPLKRISPVATTVGGIPGALPPVMGWVAARGEITFEPLLFFAILFLWQMPHFFSLAWLYKKDYARAGYKMLTVVDETGTRTSRHILANCAALIPISLIPSVTGIASTTYFFGALVAGVVFLGFGIMFAATFFTKHTDQHVRANQLARRLFFASLVYLPSLFLLMAVDKI